MSIIHATMLWIVMYAAIDGSAFASSSTIATASERVKAGAADVFAHVDAAEPELPGHAERLAREVLLLVPLESVRRDLGLREVAHRLEDRRALVRR